MLYIILCLNCFFIFYFGQIIIFNYNYSPGESKKTTESRKVMSYKHLKDIEKVIISILFLTYLRI